MDTCFDGGEEMLTFVPCLRFQQLLQPQSLLQELISCTLSLELADQRHGELASLMLGKVRSAKTQVGLSCDLVEFAEKGRGGVIRGEKG